MPSTSNELPSSEHAFADYGRIAAKIALPEGIADVGSGRGATGLVIFGSQKSAQKRMRCQARERNLR